MKVVMTLKSGLIIEIPVQSSEELESIHMKMSNFKRFFEWDARMWIRKKEVASYELVNAGPKDDETI